MLKVPPVLQRLEPCGDTWWPKIKNNNNNKRNGERRKKGRFTDLRAAYSLVMEHLKASRACVCLANMRWLYCPTNCALFTIEQRPGTLATLLTNACAVCFGVIFKYTERKCPVSLVSWVFTGAFSRGQHAWSSRKTLRSVASVSIHRTGNGEAGVCTVHLTNMVTGQVAHHLTDKGRAQG